MMHFLANNERSEKVEGGLAGPDHPSTRGRQLADSSLCIAVEETLDSSLNETPLEPSRFFHIGGLE
jgi:hypothetical protein